MALSELGLSKEEAIEMAKSEKSIFEKETEDEISSWAPNALEMYDACLRKLLLTGEPAAVTKGEVDSKK